MKSHVINFKLFLFVPVLAFLSKISEAQIEDFQVGTTTRKMLVYAPSGIETDCPLLISLHGMNQDIAYQQNQTKWESIAKENNFVVVYPGGINNSWDISGTRDIDFILAIIDEMYNRYGIDRDRVYLSGFSMGGMMTYFAATKIADKIAAFAPVSGYLMGGPNTNSSRPIPIIHTHGTADDVVAYSGVATCLNAWITRNNCPTTAEVTQPYPAGIPASNCTKYYWGPGTDSVSIVLLSLSAVGHWHSINPNGVNTSQEIWDFCKKFSLGFGVPKFKYAAVNDINPKQIQVEVTLPIKESDSFEGFSVKIDGMDAAVDSVFLSDSIHFAIELSDNILNSNEIQLSYNQGNIVSVYDKDLVSFTDTLVDNLLTGSSPRIMELSVTENGDSLIAEFNKKMLLPATLDSLALKADFNGEMNIPIVLCSYLDTDSTVLAFPLGDTVYADYLLSLNYTGDNIFSADSGLLKNFLNYTVTNSSKGLPVHIISGTLEANAIAFVLEFSKSMTMNDSQIEQITFTVNGDTTAIKEIFTLHNSIRFILPGNLYYGDSILVSYSPGNITAADRGDLEAFTEFIVENPLEMPAYYQITGKVEAENYALQYGTDTETTSDTGGGLNVGWTETGDWLVYALENNTDKTEFEILFRVAAQSSGARFDYYIDNEKAGQVNVPATGGWQVWRSVVQEISIPAGKHYLKILTVTGGYNLNYFEIQEDFVSVNNSKSDDIRIYPNPASNIIVIRTLGFQYEKIEILDIMGRSVFNKSISFLPELHLPVKLNNGIYLLRLSNGKSHYSQRIEIVN
jgi:poly(3-hydroxybutyrate) depolymerase